MTSSSNQEKATVPLPTSENDHLHLHRMKNRSLNRKLDFSLLPLLSLLYLFNGLDRGNVGNAETQGFTKDIGAKPDDLNEAISLFYVTFVILQPVSAAAGRWVGAKHWIPLLMMCWGVATIVQAYITGRGGLIAIRLLIGIFEAGFYPTSVAYLSFFYPKFDLAVRLALFYGQCAIAGAFSGCISYGVFHIEGGNLRNWQYLFIIEGSLTCVFAVLAWFCLPSDPGTAWFLTSENRAYALERMQNETIDYAEHNYAENEKLKDRLRRRDFVETAKDWRLWFLLTLNICASVPSAAMSVFLPLIVQGLGYKSIQANLMTVPPYVCGALGLYIFALSSDHRKERGYHILGGISIALAGLILTVTLSSNTGKYVGLCVLFFGIYVPAPLTVAWISNNNPEPGKRALCLGVNGFGNLGGVIGAQLYRKKFAPGYRVPFFATLGFLSVALLGYLAYRVLLDIVNKKKTKLLSVMTEVEIENEKHDDRRYADNKLTFLYGL
ncbi:hypothetical protein G7046_g2451 [Stylonectria norvegica]|nr:hypothetical protein G7046_g2451 [Stylonectria norvegica]